MISRGGTSSNKPPGLAAFDRSRLSSAQYASHGTQLRHSNTTALEAQLSVFRSLLQQFAATHARDIQSNPTFRAEFARMCNAIGVDPLASSSMSGGTGGAAGGAGGGVGSIWSQLLGRTVNDFYFGLAVRVVEVCTAARHENGGFMAVRDVVDRIMMNAHSEGTQEITEDDILRAVHCLKPLGPSYDTIRVGDVHYIRSVPRELNTDQSAVLAAVQLLGYVTASMLIANLGWHRPRAQAVLDDLIADGLLWIALAVDCGGGGGAAADGRRTYDEEPQYWTPSAMFMELVEET